MSKWTHACCDDCWNARYSSRGNPHRIVNDFRDMEICAFCGDRTRSGIYVREDPAEVPFPHVIDE